MSTAPVVAIGAVAAIACVAAFGCSSSSSSPNAPANDPDAGPSTPVTCPARVPPATDPYAIRAFVFDSSRDNPMAGALIEVRRRSDDGVILMATSNADGQADLAVPSGGKLLDIYVRATAPPAVVADHLPTRVEIQGGQIGAAVQLIVYSSAALQARAALAGTTYEAGKAVVQVGINQCNDGKKATPSIVAARITVTPGTSTHYATGDAVFDPQLMLTSAYGGGTDFGATPGATTIVTVKDGQSNTYATKTEAGVNLFALFQP